MTTKTRVAPVVTGTFKIDLPKRATKRGSESSYPFDTLTEAGMAFGLKDKTAKNLSSIISNANRKGQIDKTDEAGNVVYATKTITSPDGATPMTVPDTSKPERVAVKKFYAVDVNADLAKKLKGTPLEGSAVLVYREL